MSRDHRKLRAFTLADDLVIQVYKITKEIPSEEKYGLCSQLRRAAVSVAANIVEGSARHSEKEYSRFIEVSLASACEVQYLLSVARRLEYVDSEKIESQYVELTKSLGSLSNYLRKPDE